MTGIPSSMDRDKGSLIADPWSIIHFEIFAERNNRSLDKHPHTAAGAWAMETRRIHRELGSRIPTLEGRQREERAGARERFIEQRPMKISISSERRKDSANRRTHNTTRRYPLEMFARREKH